MRRSVFTADGRQFDHFVKSPPLRFFTYFQREFYEFDSARFTVKSALALEYEAYTRSPGGGLPNGQRETS